MFGIIFLLAFLSFSPLYSDEESSEYLAEKEYNGVTYDLLPDSTITIKHVNFSDTVATKLTIPEEIAIKGRKYPVRSISSRAFTLSSCNTVVLPSTIDSIAPYAFYACSNLTNISIPENVTKINDGAFWNCSSLVSVTLPNGLKSIGFRAFARCISLVSITVPDSCDVIGDEAFCECYEMKDLTIGTNITHIGFHAFYRLTSLDRMTIKATTPPSYSEFIDTHIQGKSLFVPEESIQAYTKDTNWKLMNVFPIE
ncbi:MAG: leucine-rich repeat domain-containing protein [Paludibacteraceae bacterium]|nr:leucine-rich repeat domain-containing protein [Paludibacteraceae bacterium]